MGSKRSRRNPWRNLPEPPSDWIVPPPNPPGFGTERPDSGRISPLVTGTVLFDNPFYNTLPQPPLGALDPTCPYWQRTVEAARRRDEACPLRVDSPECEQAREAYFEAARQYAFALDDVWGFNRFLTDPARRSRGELPGNPLSKTWQLFIEAREDWRDEIRDRDIEWLMKHGGFEGKALTDYRRRQEQKKAGRKTKKRT